MSPLKSKKKAALETVYANRRRKLLKQIRGEALLVTAAPTVTASRDHSFPFRQDSNFLYLTGLLEPNAALVLLGGNRGPRSVLFLRELDSDKERWEGSSRLGIRRARRDINVDEVRNITELQTDLPKLLAETQALHFTPGTEPKIDELVWRHFRTHNAPRTSFPNILKDARVLLAEMRFVKDREELQTIRHVVDITAQGILELAPELRHVASEIHAAKILDGIFAKLGSENPAFPTIIASGKNATSLHHTPLLQPLWRNDLVLIDAGASFRGYAGDISRVFPLSGRFNPAQAAIYDLVHNALETTIKRARRDTTLEALHQCAVETLVDGLISLKILRGNPQNIMAAARHKRFFMHRIGHHLGLDVHDITPLDSPRPSSAGPGWGRALVPGNVLTIEPGLYFDAKDETVPKRFRGIGIRLEQDILITESGSEVLSDRIPVSRSEIEMLMRS